MNTRIYIHTCTFVHTCTYVRTCIRAYIRSYIRAYTCTYAHIYTDGHTHTHSSLRILYLETVPKNHLSDTTWTFTIILIYFLRYTNLTLFSLSFYLFSSRFSTDSQADYILHVTSCKIHPLEADSILHNRSFDDMLRRGNICENKMQSKY
jgi:hypothetical protein